MPTLLTEKDFRGEIHIPGTEKDSVCEDLNRFIASHEPKFMRYALGTGFASEVYSKAALQVGREPQYDTLIVGGDYTDTYSGHGVERHLEGLKFCAARYVYCMYLRNGESLTAMVGEVKPNTDNADWVSGAQKQATAWNQMVDELRNIWHFVQWYKVDDAAAFDTSGMESPYYCKFGQRNIFGI